MDLNALPEPLRTQMSLMAHRLVVDAVARALLTGDDAHVAARRAAIAAALAQLWAEMRARPDWMGRAELQDATFTEATRMLDRMARPAASAAAPE
jgi:hypothetical protein